MRVLVTGGQGFIGKAVVDNLLFNDHEVTIFDRVAASELQKGVSFFLGDIRDQNAVEDAVSQCDGVINLAALLGTSETVKYPRESVNVNIHGALNVFQAVHAHAKRAVQIATGSRSWINTYAITKKAADLFAMMYNQEFATEIAVVEAVNVYGPYQKIRPVRKAVPSFIERGLRGDPIEVFGTGNQILDLIYIEDCAEIIVRSLTMDHGVYDRRIEAGTGKSVTALELAQMIQRLTGGKSKLSFLPKRPGEPLDSVTRADPSGLAALDWHEEDFTPLEEGLGLTIEWYKRHGEGLRAVQWG